MDLLAALQEPRYIEDPYPLYEQLRAERSVRTTRGEIVLSRYGDVTAVLGDPRFGKPPVPRLPARSWRPMTRIFLFLDPPDHTRLRRVVAPLFTQSAVAELRTKIESTAAALIPPDAETLDVVTEIAYPLPFAVVSELLDIPAEDRPQVASWSRTMTESLDTPVPSRLRDVATMLAAITRRKIHPIDAMRASAQLVRYAQQRIERAKTDPTTPFVDTLVRALAQDEIDADEATATWIMMAIAGHETTANLIGNAVLALLNDPTVLKQVTTDPALIPRAVEECLRFDTPVPFTPRVANENIELNGMTVRSGEMTVLLFAAANRDPDAFPNPDCLDLTRPKSPPHVGFAHGIHFCLGAALARLEAEAALGVLLPRLAAEHRPSGMKRRPIVSVRGLEHLPVALSRAAAPSD
jgi:vitamin D3 1,25-hydroxylase